MNSLHTADPSPIPGLRLLLVPFSEWEKLPWERSSVRISNSWSIDMDELRLLVSLESTSLPCGGNSSTQIPEPSHHPKRNEL